MISKFKVVMIFGMKENLQKHVDLKAIRNVLLDLLYVCRVSDS